MAHSKESACSVGDLGSISGLGRSPGEENWLHTPLFWSKEFHTYTHTGQKTYITNIPKTHPVIPPFPETETIRPKFLITSMLSCLFGGFKHKSHWILGTWALSNRHASPLFWVQRGNDFDLFKITQRVTESESPLSTGPWGHKELDTTERLSLPHTLESSTSGRDGQQSQVSLKLEEEN